MKGPQVTLKLILNELGIPSDITSLAGRKKVQKTIFITQSAGLNLGYTYGWYIMGPYSPELTEDYFTLNNDLIKGDRDFEKYQLTPNFSTKLKEIKPLFIVPNHVNLTQEQWLELIASIIFLRDETKSEPKLKQRIKEKKPHLVDFFNDAFQISKKYQLI
jgi:uncharacterized protein YwgA